MVAINKDQEKGTLYLIPNTLGETDLNTIIPELNQVILKRTRVFITENIRTARRFLKKVDRNIEIDAITFLVLDKHTNTEDTMEYLNDALRGKNIGLLSEAGTPCIADPGAVIVHRAHQLGIKVVPLVGPNSIIMALMASGFNGQQFQFHGYLPIPSGERTMKIRDIEKKAWQQDQTQIFIETPFRNKAMFESLLKTCRDDTELCIACNLSLEDELVMTLPIRQWKKNVPDIHKKPVVFLLYRG